MKKIRAAIQRSLHCRCGRGKVLALGMCATCYTLKQQDEEYFGGLREQVLKRDGYCCRGCGASGRGKRSIVVHHRVPGISRLHLMISLCPACHAIVSRTRVVRRRMPALLLELWREQHPDGHEQTSLSLTMSAFVALPVPLFARTDEDIL
ncbi:MAG: HNH endonuclease [Acidobacteriota bacterium]|nr:HNH endonuclease [Acidobacteriota bacterium]